MVKIDSRISIMDKEREKERCKTFKFLEEMMYPQIL